MGRGWTKFGASIFQDAAFPQGFAHQAVFQVGEVAQAPVDELGGGRRGGLGKIALFKERHLRSPRVAAS